MVTYESAKLAGELIVWHAKGITGGDTFPESVLLKKLGLESMTDEFELTEVLPDLFAVLFHPLSEGYWRLNNEVAKTWGKPIDVCAMLVYIIARLGKGISEEALKEVFVGAFNHVPSNEEWERVLRELRERGDIQHTQHGSICSGKSYKISFYKSK